MTSYLIENEAENLQNGDVHIAQIPDFEMEWNISRTIWPIEVGDGSFFFFAFFTFFHLSLTFFRPEVPFKLSSVFLVSMDLENIITLVFTGLSLILHLALHIANFRRSCCKCFAAICTFRLKAHCAVSSANWNREFCLWCGVGRSLT